MAAFTTETARAAALTKARRRLRTRINAALLYLDMALDSIEAAEPGVRSGRQIEADLTTAQEKATEALARVPTE